MCRACIFRTIFRNDGEQPLAYDLDDWHMAYRGKHLPLQTKQRWEGEWQSTDVTQAARIALRWSLLPTRQDFEPGDNNWGMTSFGLPPGESFDLSLVLVVDGITVADTLPGIVCPADQP